MVVDKLKLHAQALIAAFQFLTRVPVPVTVPFENAVLTRSVVYFPLAGAVIGSAAAGFGWLLGLVLPQWPASVLVLAFWIALSGGLHIDGWMDTADGVLSHRSRERMLEIMKDSRVGAMGVLAAVLLLLLKASLLAELLTGGRYAIALPFIAASAVWGRTWMAVAIAAWPNARQGEGIGALFGGVKLRHVGLSLSLAVLISAGGFALFRHSLEETVVLLLISLASAVVIGIIMAAYLAKKLGGLTGDTYGALNEAVEAAVLLAAVIALAGPVSFV